MEENIKLSIIKKSKNISNLINFDNIKNENLVVYKKPELINFYEIINKITHKILKIILLLILILISIYFCFY